MIGMTRQRQITAALNLFAFDNDDFYPQSVATVGFGTNWNWSAPTKLAANRTRSLALHRSVSAYLRAYIPDADTIHCPSAPKKYKYLQQAWDAGEDWDNPNTTFPADPVGGTLSLFWNYTGYIGGRKVTIKGPLGPARGNKRTNLLVADEVADVLQLPPVRPGWQRWVTTCLVRTAKHFRNERWSLGGLLVGLACNARNLVQLADGDALRGAASLAEDVQVVDVNRVTLTEAGRLVGVLDPDVDRTRQ